MHRFFIDECLSASLVAVAKERGLLADFGPHIGMAGWQDWNIARFAFENGYVVVTNNRRDFLREYLKREMHDGLGHHRSQCGARAADRSLLQRARHLTEMNDPPVNKIIEILADGTIHVRVDQR
jgi:hypothetical protein